MWWRQRCYEIVTDDGYTLRKVKRTSESFHYHWRVEAPGGNCIGHDFFLDGAQALAKLHRKVEELQRRVAELEALSTVP